MISLDKIALPVVMIPLLKNSVYLNSTLPSSAQAVIIGGGIIGSSIAYHLSKTMSDVVLLEQSQMTAGTTWHAAGLMVTFGSTSETSTQLRKYTKELYSDILPKETGLETGFKPCGFIELATNQDRLTEYRRVAAFNRIMGVDVEEIGPEQIQQLFPLARVDDVEAGFYVPTDGRVNPVDATMAMVKGAKQNGAQFFEKTTVIHTPVVNNKVTSVETDKGSIKTDIVINCAGMWARQLGQKVGVSIPNQAAEHYYLITDSIPNLDPNLPILEDPSSYTYIRPEGNGLMIGIFEPDAASWCVESIPQDFSFGEIQPDWERMYPVLEKAMNRVPITNEIGAKTLFCGPESFTPDLGPILGPAPELDNYWVAAGLNSIGIITGGGIGKLMAEWITTGRSSYDITPMNIDRFHPYQANPLYRGDRVVESLGRVYKPHFPNYGMQTARNAKVTPLYQRHLENNAYFKDVSGWECPDWFAPTAEEAKIKKYTWNRENWFPYWEKEHNACRNDVICMDMSFMSKFYVQGSDAGKLLNYLSTANIDGDLNTITYTQWLNDDGKLEADLTVAKLNDEKFLVVATDTMHRHVEYWIKKHIGITIPVISGDSSLHLPTPNVVVTDMTGSFAQLNVQGPKSRALIQKLTSVDMSDESFPFRHVKEIDIGYAKVLCIRITYLGELGYELYIPSEHSLHVYDLINKEGVNFQMVHAGLKALSSLRMEKGYRDYGHDMDNTDTLLEAGLGFTADFEVPFKGMEAVLAQKEQKKLNKRIVQVLCLDPQPMMFHAEPVLRNSVPVGYIRAASYGHTLGGAVGLCLVEDSVAINPKYIREGDWQVEIDGQFYPAKVTLRPQYDPKNEKIKM